MFRCPTTSVLLIAILFGVVLLPSAPAHARAKLKVTVGTEIRSISPAGSAPKAGRTRIVILQYAPGASRMGKPMRFVASNRKTVFVKVTDSSSHRVRVSRNAFVRFWRQSGRSCEVRWGWRTVSGHRVRFIQNISLADQGTA
jgi:hypothetical protein